MANPLSEIQLKSGEKKNVQPSDILSPINNYADLENENHNDLVQMFDVTSPGVIENLRNRIAKGIIYTNVGDILIAVNPYTNLPLYTPAVVHEYINRGEEDGLDPHVFATAMSSFRNLIANRIDQSILISGESGAGKTEATKQCLHFLSEVAKGANNETSTTSIENKILQANPLLEGFGNAKTLRNDNSSRFGKYMNVKFDSRFSITGCSTVNYLLEKTRVIATGKGERNFHVLYQLNSAAGKKAYPLLGLFDEMNVVSMMMMITLAAYNGTKRSDFCTIFDWRF